MGGTEVDHPHQSDVPCRACGAGSGERCRWKPGQIGGVTINGVRHDMVHLGRQEDFERVHGSYTRARPKKGRGLSPKEQGKG